MCDNNSQLQGFLLVPAATTTPISVTQGLRGETLVNRYFKVSSRPPTKVVAGMKCWESTSPLKATLKPTVGGFFGGGWEVYSGIINLHLYIQSHLL